MDKTQFTVFCGLSRITQNQTVTHMDVSPDSYFVHNQDETSVYGDLCFLEDTLPLSFIFKTDTLRIEY